MPAPRHDSAPPLQLLKRGNLGLYPSQPFARDIHCRSRDWRKLVTGRGGSANPNRLRRTVGRGDRNDHD